MKAAQGRTEILRSSSCCFGQPVRPRPGKHFPGSGWTCRTKGGKKNNSVFIPFVLQVLCPPASDLCSVLKYGVIIAQRMAFRKIPRARQREMPLHSWIYGHSCFPLGQPRAQHCAVAIHQEQFPFLTSICPIVSWYSLSLVLKKDSVSWIKFPRFSSCRGKEDTKN